MTFSLLTANITHGISFTAASSMPTHESLSILATELTADIVCLQEVDHLHTRSGEIAQRDVLQKSGGFTDSRFSPALIGHPGPRRNWRGATHDDFHALEHIRDGYGIAMLSRHPVDEWNRLELEGSRLFLPMPVTFNGKTRIVPIPDEPRTALAATLIVEGNRITVISTHLSFIPPTAKKQLARIVEWAEGLPGHTILAGDFNLSAKSVQRITRMKSAFTGVTYPAMKPRVQLDHIMLADDSWLVSSETLTLSAGDHLAVKAEIKLPQVGY